MGGRDIATERVIARSVEAITRRQHPLGSFPASPDFSQYGYCWLRDGSFIARALDHAGEYESASRFHAWCAAAISGASGILERALDAHSAGKPLDPSAMPPARFALDGRVVADEWPNYQVDGYGTWLWGLGLHLSAHHRPLPDSWRPVVELTARYVAAFALEPCFDVWEESGGGSAVHTSTLACVWAGLDAAARLLDAPAYAAHAGEVAAQVKASVTAGGWYPKSTARTDVDSSTLWLSAPLALLEANDATLSATVAEIERTLLLDGGVRRFADDNYFGGGAWPVLTCSLGLHHARVGRLKEAHRYLGWTLERFTDNGELGEQFFGERRDPERYRQWAAQWGPPAAELLWSHAMLILLALELAAADTSATASPSAR